jgi:hypothetical protein
MRHAKLAVLHVRFSCRLGKGYQHVHSVFVFQKTHAEIAYIMLLGTCILPTTIGITTGCELSEVLQVDAHAWCICHVPYSVSDLPQVCGI